MLPRSASSRTSSRGAFTLIELLVVIAIIAILAVVVVLTLNPAQLLAQARDANRVADLSTMNTAIGLYRTDVPGGTLGTSSVVYTSLPDSSPTCSTIAALAPLPASSTYACASSSEYRMTNGTGWIPIDFKAMSYGAPFGSLPVDPVNQASQGLYYTYETNGMQYEVTAGVQSTKYQQVCANESGTYSDLCAAGTNLTLAPINFYASSTALASIPFGTLPFNVSTTIGNATAAQTSTLTFSGTAGQTIAITFDNGSSDTFPYNMEAAQFFNPSGGQINWAYVGQGDSNGVIIANYTLPTTGTYKVTLVPENSYTGTGQVTLKMISYTDGAGTVAFNASTTMGTTYNGQSDSDTFTIATSTTIAITFDDGSSDTYPNNDAILQILDPSGNEMAWGYIGQGSGNGVVTSNLTLRTAGTYTLLLLPGNGYKGGGQVTLKMINYTDGTGTIALNASTTMSTTYIGQTDSLTFSGTASTTISVLFNNGSSDTYPNNDSMIQLLNPAGNEMLWGYSGQGSGNGVITSNLTLPTTGTYTLLLLPWNGYQGGGKVTVEVTSP